MLSKVREKLELLEDEIILLVEKRNIENFDYISKNIKENLNKIDDKYFRRMGLPNYINEMIHKIYNYYENNILLDKYTLIDIDILNIFCERIFYGIDVCKAKFSKNREIFIKLIEDNDYDNIYRQITHIDVEKKLINRLLKKLEDKDEEVRDLILKMFKECLIPYNKEIQCNYLLNNIIFKI